MRPLLSHSHCKNFTGLQVPVFPLQAQAQKRRQAARKALPQSSKVYIQVMLPSLCPTCLGRKLKMSTLLLHAGKFTFPQGQSCNTGVARGPWSIRSLRVLFQPISLEQIPYLSCQLFCYYKLSSTNFLTAWLLVSSKIVLGFSHKSSAVRPCQPLWGAGCQTATRVSKDRQTRRKPGLPCFLKACYSPFPSPLQDQQSQLYRYEIYRSIPYLLLMTMNSPRSIGSDRPSHSRPLSQKRWTFETCASPSDGSKGSKTTHRTDKVLERVQFFFPSYTLVPLC